MDIDDTWYPLLSNKNTHTMMLLSCGFGREFDLFVLCPELINFGSILVGDPGTKEPPKVFRLNNRVRVLFSFLNTKYFNTIDFSPVVNNKALGGLTDTPHF